MITVLFVDDEPMLLELSKRYLETTGRFRVDTATSAQAALQKLKAGCYDAVVSDYQLPGMDGITFLTSLRNEYPILPFLFFTGRGREEVVIGAFEKGADCFVQKGGAPKPQFTELMHKIEQAVRHRAAERELRESEQRYHAFFATTQDSVFITSDDGRWIDFNDAAIQLFGYDTGMNLLPCTFQICTWFRRSDKSTWTTSGTTGIRGSTPSGCGERTELRSSPSSRRYQSRIRREGRSTMGPSGTLPRRTGRNPSSGRTRSFSGTSWRTRTSLSAGSGPMGPTSL